MKNMKLALATAAIAATVTVFAAESAADNGTEGQGVGAVGWTPVQVGIFAPVSIPWGFDWDVKGFDLDLFYIETVKLQGLGISGIASRTRDNQDGLLISGACNWNDADVHGLGITLGANLGFGDVYGVDIATFGMRNLMKGMDVNLLASYQKDFVGWQTINSAEELHGVQIGAINVAHECPWGLQIGVINIILDNKVKILPIVNGYFGGSEE